MACSFKYKGITYPNKNLLKAAVLSDINSGKLKAIPEPNQYVYKLTNNINEIAVLQKISDMFESTDFASVIEDSKTGERYVVLDEVLMDQQNSPVKSFRDSTTNEVVELNVDNYYERFKAGDDLSTTFNKVRGLKTSMKIKMLDEVIIEETQRAKRPATLDTNSQVLQKLRDFATSMGISVVSMDQYIEQYSKKNGVPPTVEALADIMEQVIAVSNDRSVEQLSEEVAHFAVEYFNDQGIIDSMLERIPETDVYKAEAAKYRQLYSKQASGQALERMVRKEVLGKILAERMIKNLKEDSPRNAITRTANQFRESIFQPLGDAIQRFFDMFRITDANQEFFRDFGKVLDDISLGVREGRTEGFSAVQSREVYYAATAQDQQIQDSLTNFLRQMQQVYNSLSKGTARSFTNQKRAQIQKIIESIGQADYMRALHASLMSLSQDMQRTNTAIRDAKATMAQRKEVGYENMLGHLGNVNAQNLITFYQNIPQFLKMIDNFLETIEGEIGNAADNNPLGQISQSDIARLKELSNQLKSSVQENISDFRGLAKAKTKLELKTTLGAKASQEDVNDELIKLSTNVYEDLSWFNAKVYSFYESAGHPALKLIAALYLKSVELVKQHTDRVYGDMVDLQQRLGLSREDTAKLMKDGFMLNPWKMREYLKDKQEEINKINEEYEKQLATLDKSDPQFLVKDAKIRDSWRAAMLAHSQKWTETRFTAEFYAKLADRKTGVNYITKSSRRLQQAQDILRDYSASKNKILSKYYDKTTGKVNYNNITVADNAELKQIYSDIKAMQSMYNSDGTLKDDLELAIALDIRDYFSASDAEISPEAEARFEQARQEAERTLSKADYKLWLSTFAYQSYDIDYDTSEFEVDVDDTEAALQAAGGLLDFKIRATQNLLLTREVNGTLQVTKLDENSSMQDIYDALRQKKQNLLKPYRSSSISGEIDGAAVDRNQVVRAELDMIDSFLRSFQGNWADGQIDFERMGNSSFQKELKRIKQLNDPRALSNWLYENTIRGKKDRFGRPVPSKSYYTSFTPIENGYLLERTPKPKFLWEMTSVDQQFLNPNFNEELAQKGAPQPKLSQEMQDKYFDQEYFELFGIDKGDIYSKNPTRNKNLFESREYFLELKRELDRKADISNGYYQLPQVRRYANESAVSGPKLKAWFKRNFVVDNYDEDFGEKSNKAFGVNTKSIPRYFTKLMEDPGELTKDIGYMYMSYAQMAYNYSEKGKIVTDINLMRDTVANSQTPDGKALTNTLTKLDSWLDSFMYGNKSTDMGEFSVFGTKISVTKILRALYKFVSNANLAFNIYVPVVGQITSTTQRRVLAATKKYFSDESLNWAQLNASKTVPRMFLESGKLVQKSIGDNLLNFSGIARQEQMTKGIFTNRANRSVMRANPGYLAYEMFSKTNGVVAVMAVYDNNRLYKDEVTGKSRFINRQQFNVEMQKRNPNMTKQEIDTAWTAMRPNSFYNYLKPTSNSMELDRAKMIKDGVLEQDIDTTAAFINRTAENAHNMIEGQTSQEERALFSKHPIGALLYMHRGFLQRGIEGRFKKKDFDYITGTEDEGNYRTAGRLFSSDTFKQGGGFRDLAIMGSYMLTAGANANAVENNLDLSENEKANLRRMGRGMYTITGLFALYMLANLAGDDDENDESWSSQYMAYISSRAFVESISTTALGAGDFLKILDSPAAGVNTIKTFTELPSFIYDAGDEVTKGPYEGLTKNQAKMIKLTPVKNIYAPLLSDDPAGAIRSSNVFFRQNVIPSTSELLLNAVSDDK